ncbi:MAG: O-antigen ligase family protein [Planctomycetota bacterium]
MQTIHPLNTPWTRQAALVAAGVVAACGLVVVGHDQPKLGLGLLYLAAFAWLSWVKPIVPLTLIVALTPFVQNLGGGGLAFSIAEVNLALFTAVFLTKAALERRPIHIGPIIVPVALYFAVCVFASIPTLRSTSITSIAQMGLYMVVAVSVFASAIDDDLEELKKPFLGLIAVTVCLAAAVTAAREQYFLGLHKNLIGAVSSCGFIAAVEFALAGRDRRVRLFAMASAAVLAVGMVSVVSRGAWLASLTGMVVIFVMRRRVLDLFKLCVVMAPFIAIAWLALPEGHRSYAVDFDAETYNIRARYRMVDHAYSFFEQSPVYGVGVGLRKEYDATNLAMLTLAETGVIGLVCLIIIHAAVLWMVLLTARTMRRDDPLFTLVVLAAALLISRMAHGMVDHYWSRGPIMTTWAAVGCATAVYVRQHGAEGLIPRVRQPAGEPQPEARPA